MKAFVLAAGEGSRLRPLTDDLPKPMVSVCGRPLLEYNIRLLVHYGITEIAINTHYRAEKIINFFGDGSRFGASITYTSEPTLLGTAGALNNALRLLDESFLLVFGDNLSTCDIPALIASHEVGDAGVLGLFSREDVSQSGVALIDQSNRILAFVEKPSPGEVLSHWVNAGILLVTPALARLIPRQGVSDFGRDIFPAALRAGLSLRGYPMRERLWWIDSLADYEKTVRDPHLGELLDLLALRPDRGIA